MNHPDGTIEAEAITRSKERVKALGEVFTPAKTVSEMLDKLSAKSWAHDCTVLEPTCGTGNFLVQILQRKLDAGHPPLVALSTIYGVDIMKDNVNESRKRMLQIALDGGLAFDDLADAVRHLKRNIIVGNALETDLEKLWND